MKPVTGRPKNVTGAAADRVAATAVLSRTARSETLEPMPSAVAPLPMNIRRAQPFWNVEFTLTFVRLSEPSTVEAVLAGMCAAPLRIDRTFDSQHSEFGAPAGGSGEKSVPAATALASSRLKNVKLTVSHAPEDVRMLVYGCAAVVDDTNTRFSGWVMTQSVFDAEPVSSTYSLMTF